MRLITKYWSVFGGTISLLLVLYLINTWHHRAPIFSWLWIHLCILLLHQLEEYSVPGGFQNFYNRHIAGRSKLTTRRLTQPAILWINVFVAWPAYSCSVIFYDEFPALALALVLITITNGMLHSGLFIRLKKYNPGFITGFFFMIPFGLFLLIQLTRDLSRNDWISSLVIFIIGSSLIPLNIALLSDDKNQQVR